MLPKHIPSMYVPNKTANETAVEPITNCSN